MTQPETPDRPEIPLSEPVSTPEGEPTGAKARALARRHDQRREVQDKVAASASAHMRPERMEAARELAIVGARIADDNRGRDIKLLDMRTVTSLVDYFLIVGAGSRRQALAIAGEIDAEMKQRGEKKLGLEGWEEGRWILIDYGDFVVHVFAEDAREYYALEEIWGDAATVAWADPSRPVPPETGRL